MEVFAHLPSIIGVVFILSGLAYILKPDLFKILPKNQSKLQKLPRDQFLRYMRSLGTICIVLGILLLLFGKEIFNDLV